MVWAMRRNNRAAVKILEAAGATRAPQIQGAVEKALGLLQKSSPQFIRVSGWRVVPSPDSADMAMAVARRHGIKFDEAEAQKDIDASAAMWRNAREYMTRDSNRIPNPPIVIPYSLVGFAAANYPADETTAAMVKFIAGFQQADGSWRSQFKRPPIESSDFTATAMSIRGIQKYGDDDAAVARGAAWLAQAEPHTNEDRSMQLLGLAWAKADRANGRRAWTETARKTAGGWRMVAARYAGSGRVCHGTGALRAAYRGRAQHLRRGVQGRASTTCCGRNCRMVRGWLQRVRSLCNRTRKADSRMAKTSGSPRRNQLGHDGTEPVDARTQNRRLRCRKPIPRRRRTYR